MADYNLAMSGDNIKSAINSAFSKLDEIPFADDRVLISSGGKIDASTIATSELAGLDGVTENIQVALTLLKPAFGSAYLSDGTTSFAVSSTPSMIKYDKLNAYNMTMTNISTFKATILKAGCYKVGYFASYNPSATTTISAVVKKNGVNTHIGSSGSVETNKPRSVCVESKLNLDVDDYIELFLSSGANVTLTHTHGGFNLEYLGPIGTVV